MEKFRAYFDCLRTGLSFQHDAIPGMWMTDYIE